MSFDLRLGDCLAPERLPSLGDGSVDVTITDPPFDARTHRVALEAADWRAGPRRVAGRHAKPLPFPPLETEQLERVAAELARVTRRWIVVFTGEFQLDAWRCALEANGARCVRVGIAARFNGKPQLTGDRPAPAADLLLIAHAGRHGKMRWNGGGKMGLWWAPAARFDLGGQQHPTQKPLALMRALVEDFSDAGELVCDPFAGSGTTAVACAETGRRFVGWERDPTYHAAAVARLDPLVRTEDVDQGDGAAPGGGQRKASTSAPEASTVGEPIGVNSGDVGVNLPERTCERCGDALLPSARADARYHRSCRELAYRARKRALDGEAA